jgi:hypothetical protein
MSDTSTPNLKLPYIDPNQAQPEVKINDAWDILDAFAGETGLGGSSLEVEQLGDSPGKKNVRKIVIDGATVSAETDDTVLITIDSSSDETGGGGNPLTVQDSGESPGRTVTDVVTIRFDGATVIEESAGVALVTIPIVEGPEGPTGATGATGAAGSVWRNGSGAPSNSLGVNGDYYLDTATGNVYTKSSGAYSIVANIEGPTGATGATGAIGATGATGAQQPPGAAWITLISGVAIALPVNAVPRVISGTYNIKECDVVTEGGPGSCVINVWKLNIGTGYPPTSANDITGGNNVVLSSVSTHADSTLTGWTVGLVQGDVILFTLASTSSFTYIGISLRIG